MKPTQRDFLKSLIGAATIGAALLTTQPVLAKSAETLVPSTETATTVSYQKARIQGIDIAYRESGRADAPAIVLLHGFPTSSHMFRELIPQLAKNYHVVAPDYPGYGASDQPALADFEYSFANFANVVEEPLAQKKINRYALYVMDYGAPVGFRLFAKAPEKVSGFVIQNGNAYAEGLKKFWDPLKAYCKVPSEENGNKLKAFFELPATKWKWTHGIPKDKLYLVSPDNWVHDQYLLDRPGNKAIQLKMFLDYGTNVAEYPGWQKLFRQYQPPALIVWGKGDHIFPADGAHPYTRDLKTVEMHLLDAGHFALETHLDFITERMQAFLKRTAGS